MKIVAQYSFKRGLEEIDAHYPALLREIKAVILSVDANLCQVKLSKEKTRGFKMLYDPKALNKEFKREFKNLGWNL